MDSTGLSQLGDFESSGQLGEPIESRLMKKSGATFFGIESSGESFVFVIDCSGSMENELRWHRARQELKYAIQSLNKDQRFLVLLYNDRTYIMMDQPLSELGMTAANDFNKTRLIEWLWRQYPSGGTFPMNAMQIGLELSPDAIFLLSDGEIRDRTAEMLAKTNGFRAQMLGRNPKSQFTRLLSVRELAWGRCSKLLVKITAVSGKFGSWTDDCQQKKHRWSVFSRSDGSPNLLTGCLRRFMVYPAPAVGTARSLRMGCSVV